jgi:acetolactate synthase I/II/III large subunit
MAMQTYYRVSGEITAAIVTAGGGSSNAITGVLSAWADSIPGIIISGQENTRFINSMNGMRIWGVQGFDIVEMVKKITKYSVRVMKPERSIYELQKAYHISTIKRPGPVWIDYPMDIQGSKISKKSFEKYHTTIENKFLVNNEIKATVELIKDSSRPVFWFGQGIRIAKAEKKIKALLDCFPFPFLVSWAGMDMVESSHPLNYGRAGVYGSRAGNFVVQNSDLVIAIGNRMSIPMIGYEQSEFARNAKIIQVDIDKLELEKTKSIVDIGIQLDAGEFINKIIQTKNNNIKSPEINNWIETCNGYKDRYPLIGPEHEDNSEYINSYRFMDKLSDYLKNDQIIVTDTGTALLSGHQSIRIKSKQRLMTSTGLGEMGCGLPGAIGASFAKNRGEIICLNCDGGMMMNLQELQTIAHHSLPIKIFIFNNNGYLMIKHTQKNLFEGRYSGTDNKSGVSLPDFSKLSVAFDFPYFSIRTWDDFDDVIPKIQNINEAIICDVFMDPEQYFYPKLSLALQKDGTIISPPLEDLSPLLDRKKLGMEMIIGLHEKSKGLDKEK